MKTFFPFLKIFLFVFTVGVMLSKPCLAAEVPAATASTPYPLSICVVSGDKLGEMGAPVIVQHNGTEVRFCCKECVKDFDKDPDKYLNRLHTAEQNPK